MYGHIIDEIRLLSSSINCSFLHDNQNGNKLAHAHLPFPLKKKKKIVFLCLLLAGSIDLDSYKLIMDFHFNLANDYKIHNQNVSIFERQIKCI